MSDQEMKYSELVEIAKRNGDFSKNYGPLLGGLLYWLSIKAVRPRPFWWSGLFVAGGAGVTAWLQSRGWLIVP